MKCVRGDCGPAGTVVVYLLSPEGQSLLEWLGYFIVKKEVATWARDIATASNLLAVCTAVVTFLLANRYSLMCRLFSELLYRNRELRTTPSTSCPAAAASCPTTSTPPSRTASTCC
jgi:hypothetical protein